MEWIVNLDLLDGQRWVSCRPLFLLPVEVLSALFRGLFLDKLRAAYRAGVLQFFGKHAPLSDPQAFAAYHCPGAPSRRDFVPWRFSDAGRWSASLDHRYRRPKT